jgi:hypothetical protein
VFGWVNDGDDRRALAQGGVAASTWIVGLEGRRAAIADGGGNRVGSDTDDDSDPKCFLLMPTA